MILFSPEDACCNGGQTTTSFLCLPLLRNLSGRCAGAVAQARALPVQIVWAAGNATGQALTADDFYTNELCKQYYKNHVSFVLNHVNKQTGLQYKVQYILRNDGGASCVSSCVSCIRCNCIESVFRRVTSCISAHQ